MLAAAEFADYLQEHDLAADVAQVRVELFGSLSATGVGHGTDKSVVIGLLGERPALVNPEIIDPTVESIKSDGRLNLLGKYDIEFIWERDMLLLEENLPYHPNAMRLNAYSAGGEQLYSNTYYSIGGGFVIDESHASSDAHLVPQVELPYEFNNAVELLELCKANNFTISQLMMENEKSGVLKPKPVKG